MAFPSKWKRSVTLCWFLNGTAPFGITGLDFLRDQVLSSLFFDLKTNINFKNFLSLCDQFPENFWSSNKLICLCYWGSFFLPSWKMSSLLTVFKCIKYLWIVICLRRMIEVKNGKDIYFLLYAYTIWEFFIP